MFEIWKDIEGYEGKYLISNCGNVKSLIDKNGNYRETIIVARMGNTGYLYVNLYKHSRAKSLKIHRLVANAFVDKPDNAQCVNHIDGNKTNNNANNLEWCTYKENTQHAYKFGLAKVRRGKNNGMYGKHGSNNKNSIPVLQYDINGNFIKKWDNAVVAAQHLKIDSKGIRKCARGERKTAYNYIWKSEEQKQWANA